MNAAVMECRPLVAGSEAERQYLESLNVCFPGWGGREMFDWCFSRESAGSRPDLMMLHDDAGRPLAGTANTYRRVGLPNGQTMVVGIMTGSWTLPEARGRGAFTRLIEESRELAAARQAGLLLAFCTRTNGSAGRLQAAGSALIPSWYCRSSPERRTAAAVANGGARAYVESRTGDASAAGSDGSGDGMDTYRSDYRDIADAVRLIYTADEWRDQFERRPNAVMRVLGESRRWSALVDRTPAFDRVLSLTVAKSSTPEADGRDDAWADAIVALDARAAAAGRHVFCYTTQSEQASALRERGFEIIDGYMSVLAANEAVVRSACARTGGGRESLSASSHALAEPASPWYLGAWAVRNGDRM
jgi:hypothetical protein